MWAGAPLTGGCTDGGRAGCGSQRLVWRRVLCPPHTQAAHPRTHFHSLLAPGERRAPSLVCAPHSPGGITPQEEPSSAVPLFGTGPSGYLWASPTPHCLSLAAQTISDPVGVGSRVSWMPRPLGWTAAQPRPSWQRLSFWPSGPGRQGPRLGRVPVGVSRVWLEQGLSRASMAPREERQPGQMWVWEMSVRVSGLSRRERGACPWPGAQRIFSTSCQVTKGMEAPMARSDL